MSNRERYAIFPSRANLVAIKARMSSARKGLHMLKSKRDAIELKLRDLNGQIQKLDDQKGELMNEGLSHIARARFHGTDFEPYLVAIPSEAETYCTVDTIRIVGVALPTLSIVKNDTNYYNMAGLARGGEETQAARLKFLEVLDLLIQIASLKYSIVILGYNLRQTNTRCNAIEYVVIPRIEATKRYIEDALEEQEREDFYRLKCSKGKQDKRKYTTAEQLDMNDFLGKDKILHPEVKSADVKEEPIEKSASVPSAPFWWESKAEPDQKYSTKEVQTEGVYVEVKVEPKETKTTKTQTDDSLNRKTNNQRDFPKREKIIRVENYAQTLGDIPPNLAPTSLKKPEDPLKRRAIDPYISATTEPVKRSRPKSKPITNERNSQTNLDVMKPEIARPNSERPNAHRRKRSKMPKESKAMQTDF